MYMRHFNLLNTSQCSYNRQLYHVGLSFSPALYNPTTGWLVFLQHNLIPFQKRIRMAKYQREIFPRNNNVSPPQCLLIYMREILVELPAIILVCGAAVYV